MSRYIVFAYELIICEIIILYTFFFFLIADLGVRGVWEPQAMALFDIRVVDTDARPYLSHSPSAVLASAEAENKRSNYFLNKLNISQRF